MFQLIGYMDSFAICGNTSHIANRSKRLQIAERLIIEECAKVVKIYNARTHKFITVLIARVPQIERYKIKVTKTMKNKIKSHIAKGYNHIEF